MFVVLRRAYAAFNARDIDALLALLQPDVEWPNGMDGGWLHGHAAVREYWLRQWTLVDPHSARETVEPLVAHVDGDAIVVTVHQTVRDLAGKLIVEQDVQHAYWMRDGLIARMEIRAQAS